MLFMAIITAPSIIMVVDDSLDISVFYSLSEEEEETTHLKIVFPKNDNTESLFSDLYNIDELDYFFKKYAKPHLSFTSPPPDFI
ncbi:hypothetical protein BWR22_01580 [Lacinutrix venerupis]|uniref:Uncharacterized protein n=2 Tax=Lacinutrix venerupis TaxID=1486034 RepID=A0AAC9PY95_9FLAO|nr:hypothetical protein BWR22_01580 [Lacinutrix venerupis]